MIPILADTAFLSAREAFSASFEAVTGLRCGEVFGAQMGHGVMANGVSILTWVGAEGYKGPPGVAIGEVFVEAATETSKAKVGRCVSVVGTTKGPAKVAVADALRAWWSACDFAIWSRVEEGWRVETPDFWVIQIPLMGLLMNGTKMDKLRGWLGPGEGATGVERVALVAKALHSELTAIPAPAAFLPCGAHDPPHLRFVS